MSTLKGMTTNSAPKPPKLDNVTSLPALKKRLGVRDLKDVDVGQFQRAHDLAAEGKVDSKTLARFVSKVPHAVELGLEVMHSWNDYNRSATEGLRLMTQSLLGIAESIQDENLKREVAELQYRAFERSELTKVEVAKEFKGAFIWGTAISVLGAVAIAFMNRKK